MKFHRAHKLLELRFYTGGYHRCKFHLERNAEDVLMPVTGCQLPVPSSWDIPIPAHPGICMFQRPTWRPRPSLPGANLVTIMHASLNILHMNFNENCVVELAREMGTFRRNMVELEGNFLQIISHNWRATSDSFQPFALAANSWPRDKFWRILISSFIIWTLFWQPEKSGALEAM